MNCINVGRKSSRTHMPAIRRLATAESEIGRPMSNCSPGKPESFERWTRREGIRSLVIYALIATTLIGSYSMGFEGIKRVYNSGRQFIENIVK